MEGKKKERDRESSCVLHILIVESEAEGIPGALVKRLFSTLPVSCLCLSKPLSHDNYELVTTNVLLREKMLFLLSQPFPLSSHSRMKERTNEGDKKKES